MCSPPPRRAAARRWNSRRPTNQAIFMLLLFTTLVSYGRADPRRSISELGPTILGVAQHLRGGITIYGTLRQFVSESSSEQSSRARMKQEGFDPRRAFRQRTHIWSSNCQMMNSWRLENWGRELEHCFGLIQGTQLTYDPAKGEKGTQQCTTTYHDVYEARTRKRAKAL